MVYAIYETEQKKQLMNMQEQVRAFSLLWRSLHIYNSNFKRCRVLEERQVLQKVLSTRVWGNAAKNAEYLIADL